MVYVEHLNLQPHKEVRAMITEIIITIFYGILWVLISPIRLLGDVSVNSSVAAAISTASGFLASINTFLPATTLLTILGIFLGVEVSILIYKLIMWVIRRIPGQG